MTVMASTLARRRGRIMLAFPVLTLLLCVLAVVHLGVGARTISPQTVVQALFHFDAKNFDHRIIVSLRLLRMTAAMLVGAALGVAGVLLQALIRNPLGEPHILGLNAGAAFVVVLCTALGVTGVSQPLLAARRCCGTLFVGDGACICRARWLNAAEGHAVRRGAVGHGVIAYCGHPDSG